MASVLRSPGNALLTPAGLKSIKARADDALSALRIQHVANSIIGASSFEYLSLHHISRLGMRTDAPAPAIRVSHTFI